MKRFAHIALTLLAVLSVPTFAQNALDKKKEEQLTLIESQMAANDSRAVKGLLIGLAGAGVMTLSLAFIPGEEYVSYDEGWKETGNPALFWSCLVGGGIMMAWGGLKISSAAAANSELKRKWHDLKYSFQPLYMPQQGDAVGIALVGKF